MLENYSDGKQVNFILEQALAQKGRRGIALLLF
jgi:hypothetical protein